MGSSEVILVRSVSKNGLNGTPAWYCSVATQYRIRSASMGSISEIVECLANKLFAHAIDEKMCLKSVVVGGHFVKALRVRQPPAEDKKDIAYVALSICSSVRDMDATTR